MVVTLSGLGETGLTRRGAVKAKITKHSGSGRVASGKRLSPVLEIPWVNQVANKGRLYSQNYRHLHSSFILLSHLLNLFDTLSYKVSVIFVPFQFAVNSMQPHCHALPVFRCSLCCQTFPASGFAWAGLSTHFHSLAACMESHSVLIRMSQVKGTVACLQPSECFMAPKFLHWAVLT
jgi:hypothetical protein